MDEYIDPIDNGRPFPALSVLSAKEVLKRGLELLFKEGRIHRVTGDPYTSATNIQRFKNHFGANPAVVALIWADLQTTIIAKARITVLKFDMFLWHCTSCTVTTENQKGRLSMIDRQRF